MQNCGMAIPFRTCAEGLSTQTVGEDLCSWPASNFGPRTGLNLSEDLFFSFGFHLILGKKKRTKFWVKTCFLFVIFLVFIWFWTGKPDRLWEEKCLIWSLLFSNFLNFLPPLSKNLRTLLVTRQWLCVRLTQANRNAYHSKKKFWKNLINVNGWDDFRFILLQVWHFYKLHSKFSTYIFYNCEVTLHSLTVSAFPLGYFFISIWIPI